MDCRLSASQVEKLRVQVQVVVESMVERLVVQVQEAEITLEGMERAVLAGLHRVGNTTLGALTDALAPRYAPPHVACGCGGEAVYQRRRKGQCKTLLGVVGVTRPYYLCAGCHRGYCPLDRELGFCAGGVSGGLAALMALLGSEFSFAQSARMVQKLSLVQVSATRCREATLALGACVAVEEEQEREAVWEQTQAPAVPPALLAVDPLYISADGVIVHTRESGWREQCVGALYTTTSHRHAIPHPHRHSSEPSLEVSSSLRTLRSRASTFVSELGSRPNFAQLLWLEAHRRGLEQAKTVVFIGDGAHWLWETAHDLFPAAIQILDWYHASSYLWGAAQALFPHSEIQRKAWAAEQMAALWQSRTAQVIAHLQPLADTHRAIHEAVTYFTGNQLRMDYKRYRALGLQVGSGTIESACKHVIQARLKQAGMRWSVKNARTMGKLRARLKSDRWQETLALRPLPSRSCCHHST